MNARRFTLTLSALALAAGGFAAHAADHSYSNTTSISIPNSGIGTPFPSTINVSGLAGNVNNVRVTLNNLSHTFSADIDILLVSPTGQQVTLMSDAGAGSDWVNATVTFSATAATGIPNPVASGTYLPTDISPGDFYPAPAPANTSTTNLASFDGPAANANGTWSLYVLDDLGGDVGQIAGGWTLTFADAQSCASEGYTSTKLEWCKNICERGYTGATLDMWIRRWVDRYRTLPYCAIEAQPQPE